jgi:hypothetical protein
VENTILGTSAAGVPEALLFLLGLYYVMDIQYPKCFSPLLGFFQVHNHALHKDETFFKGLRYTKFHQLVGDELAK